MNLSTLIASATQQLSDAGILTARLDCLVLLEHVINHDRTWIAAHADETIAPKAQRAFEELLARRLKREPVAYIVSHKEFYGLEFAVTPDVLIPRPETEALVEYAITRTPKNAHVLELGTGSGCIAVALKKHRPDLHLTATDISSAVLDIAESNARSHDVSIQFIESDLFSRLQGQDSTFQLILANLPYVPDDTRHEPELDYEPRLALYAGDDGLDLYRKFFADVKRYLAPDGAILIEASPVQHKGLKDLAAQHGFALKEVTEYISEITTA